MSFPVPFKKVGSLKTNLAEIIVFILHFKGE